MATNNKTSLLVDAQLPDFLETDGPQFQAFIKAYYKWLETTNQYTDRSKNLLNYQDIDKTADEFLTYFKREILSQFPIDILADKKLVYQKIKELYRAKGTKESYQLLFRILYNEEIDIYFPGDDLLRASDGRWVKETSIRVTGPFVGAVDQMGGETITGVESGATAKVERISLISDEGVLQYELFISNINGEFNDGEQIRDSQSVNKAIVMSKQGTLQKVIVTSGGSGHQKNDNVNFTSTSGSSGTGVIQVTDANANGAIVSVSVTNAGSSYKRTEPITIVNTSRSANNATGAGLLTSTISYTGRYDDTSGFLSWSNKLQDNKFYQEFSYVIRSGQVLDTYKEIVKNVVHPAGVRLFGDVLIDLRIDGVAPTIARENVLSKTEPSVAELPLLTASSMEQFTRDEIAGHVDSRPEVNFDLDALQTPTTVYTGDKENHTIIIEKISNFAPTIEINPLEAIISIAPLASPHLEHGFDDTIRTTLLLQPGKIENVGINPQDTAAGDITIEQATTGTYYNQLGEPITPISSVTFGQLVYRGLGFVPEPYWVAESFGVIDGGLGPNAVVPSPSIIFEAVFVNPVTTTTLFSTDYSFDRTIEDTTYGNLVIGGLSAQVIANYVGVSLDSRLQIPTSTIISGADTDLLVFNV